MTGKHPEDQPELYERYLSGLPGVTGQAGQWPPPPPLSRWRRVAGWVAHRAGGLRWRLSMAWRGIRGDIEDW